MGCQRENARTIVDKKADYVLALKGNLGTLRDDVALFATFQDNGMTRLNFRKMSRGSTNPRRSISSAVSRTRTAARPQAELRETSPPRRCGRHARRRGAAQDRLLPRWVDR